MKKTFEELNAIKFDIVEHFGMQKKSEFFIMNTVAPAEYGADADYQYYEVDVKTDEDMDALKAFIEDLFGMKGDANIMKQVTLVLLLKLRGKKQYISQLLMVSIFIA